MYKAYVRTDPQENPAAIEDLKKQLGNTVTLIATDKSYSDIVSSTPFLYFRNPYVRFGRELEVAAFHGMHSHFPCIKIANNEVVSVNPFALGNSNYNFPSLKITYFDPPEDPLPVVMGIHKRHTYVQLTLNSLLYSFQSPKQKLYIVLSDPDEKMLNIVKAVINKHNHVDIQAVVSNNNLFYGFLNFGTKFFNLDRIICFDEDVILPESLSYQIPYWTSQFNYRASTADLVGFKVSTENYTANTLNWLKNSPVSIPNTIRWHYANANPPAGSYLPIGGGMGMVISSSKIFENNQAPTYGTSDSAFCKASKTMCIANIATYHIGANEKMDYPEYFKKKHFEKRMELNRYQEGRNLITGETKTIDMEISWGDHQS